MGALVWCRRLLSSCLLHARWFRVLSSQVDLKVILVNEI